MRDRFRNTHRSMFKIERSSEGANFLYYSLRGNHPPKGWQPPQVAEQLTYQQFEQEALAAESDRRGWSDQRERGLLYLTVSAGAGAQIDWIRRGLEFFLPSDESRAPGTGLKGHEFFDVDRQVPYHGINCRLGMRGIIQAAHYDGYVRGVTTYAAHTQRSHTHTHTTQETQFCGDDIWTQKVGVGGWG